MTEKVESPNKTDGPGPSFPLFYRKPAPLNPERHGNKQINPGLGFGFAAETNAVPLQLNEVALAVSCYPIVFAGSDPPTLVAVLGLQSMRNLFVNGDGRWAEDSYIPAYVRRYPFIFAQGTNADRLTLCVDEADAVLIPAGGDGLFASDGSTGPVLQNALSFCQSYDAAARASRDFCAAVEAQGLLVDGQADIKLTDGSHHRLTQFRNIDTKAFASLSGETLTEWRDCGWLMGVYGHLLSLTNWTRLYHRFEHFQQAPTKGN